MKVKETSEDKIKKGVCPECGAPLVFQSGCKYCPNCGWEACG